MNPELELLKQMAHTIAMQFGRDCEVIIHEDVYKRQPLPDIGKAR